MIPNLTLPDEGGGLFIKSGITLDVKSYLEGLWQTGLRFGLQFHQKALTEESDFKRYDRVIFAGGLGVKKFPPLSDLPLTAVKGQSLLLKWPTNIPPLPFSLFSDGYVVMGKEGKTCIAGATFEREFKDDKPNTEVAYGLIKEKLLPFFPALNKAEILDCYAGIRAMPPTERAFPYLGKVQEKYWFVTGLGSKGLLFHGYLGDILAQAILADNPSLIPPELHV